MEIRQLEYLVAVAEAGSFTAAADALGVSQPSVSQGLKALENELGVGLLERLPRGAALTAAGRALLPAAQAALRDLTAGRSAVDAVRGLEAGSLDVVCLPTLAAEPTARLVGELRRRHPGVRVRIAQPESLDDLLGRIRDGRSEVAVTELDGDLSGLEAHELERQDVVALVPARRAPASLTVAQLAEAPIVTAPVGTSTRRQLEEVFAGIGREPDVVVESEHREAMAALVAAGAGIAVVARPASPLPTGSGVAVAELATPVRRRIGLVHRSGPLARGPGPLVDRRALGARGRPPTPGPPASVGLPVVPPPATGTTLRGWGHSGTIGPSRSTPRVPNHSPWSPEAAPTTPAGDVGPPGHTARWWSVPSPWPPWRWSG